VKFPTCGGAEYPQEIPPRTVFSMQVYIIQYLADTDPNYEGKDKVRELMAQAKKHSGVKPGTPAKPLN
jgi:hypothetical protein